MCSRGGWRRRRRRRRRREERGGEKERGIEGEGKREREDVKGYRSRYVKKRKVKADQT